MLPKENRLSKQKDFQKLLKKDKQSKFYACPFFLMKILENGLENPRFGIIVSGKVSKSAVVRNKIKRRIREIIRDKLSSFKKNLDVVVIARASIKDLDYDVLKKELEKSFKFLKII